LKFAVVIVFGGGKKLDSGCVAEPVPCTSPDSDVVNPSSNSNYDIHYSIDTVENQNQTLAGPFSINGPYYFHHPNSKITGQHFNFKLIPPKPCDIISLNC